MHFDLRPPGHLVPFRRRGQQRALLSFREHLRGPLPGRAVDPLPRPLRAPDQPPRPGVGQVGELLPGEEADLHEIHPGLHPPLVLRGTDPGRISAEPPRLGVLQPAAVPHRVHRISPGHDRFQVIRDEDPENTPEKYPRLLTARDHLLCRLGERQVRKAVPGEHRGEHQRPQQPPPALMRDHPQIPEIDLQLLARLAVIHPDRDARPAAGEPAPLDREPVQRPVRDTGALTGQQLADPGDRQPGLHPLADLLLQRHQQLPRIPVPVRPRRADRAQHRTHKLLAQLPLTAITDQPRRNRSPDIPPRRLHVHPGALSRWPRPRPRQPRPQHLLNLNHRNLPV
jgi:hypothetical protein